MYPDILVVTATLGDRETLNQTVTSVKAIGKNRVKHILIAPKDKCETIKEMFPNVDVLEEPINCGGIYSALNYAIENFGRTYAYITFINDDDYWLESYQQLFDFLDHHPNVDAVYSRTCFVDNNGIVLGEQACSPRYQAFNPLLFTSIVLFTQQSALIRSSVYFSVGGFDTSFKLAADTLFWSTAIALGAKFKYINIVSAAYTIQKNQLSSDKKTQSCEHQRILNAIKRPSHLRIIFEKILFLIWNTRIYCKRVISRKQIKNLGGSKISL
ncbi:MAG: hypothetical protein H6Q17_2765 [Bacteroidetes bacterium]|nr:hypothetical protein [Bacteroidota bacterium]